MNIKMYDSIIGDNESFHHECYKCFNWNHIRFYLENDMKCEVCDCDNSSFSTSQMVFAHTSYMVIFGYIIPLWAVLVVSGAVYEIFNYVR